VLVQPANTVIIRTMEKMHLIVDTTKFYNTNLVFIIFHIITIYPKSHAANKYIKKLPEKSESSN